ncbi:DHH family phosphoesterase [Desulforhopalus vacuolatus]|uniref:DHH family phosphoesterase n=1 Tax=Desulforhopalus vacuolatus TaxID=40414 RepID=UPI001963855B|nr:DHH family phosphoesterase [Desulforhopalus vacuolatus]MBM9518709.1 DHH family phosphoesterase [Desulforhopalus vacuolatus]
MIPQQVLDDLRNSSRIVAVTHIHPDGDALGSLLAFASIMESLGKEVFCLLEEPVSHLYSFLPGQERLSWDFKEVRAFFEKTGEKVTGVSLDCGDAWRIGSNIYKEISAATPFVVIDHHASHKKFGNSSWVDEHRSSTGEMLYEIAEALSAEISWEAAYNLYVAIMTDTGSFRYENTSSRTMHIAAELLEKGVSAEDVAARIYDNYSPARLCLLQKCLGSVNLLENSQIAVMTLSREMLATTGALIDDVENFINIPRAVKPVKVAMFLKEGSGGQVSVSLRAKGEVDVSKIAGLFGGGGHHNAAGFQINGSTLEKAEALILKLLRKEL